MRKLKKWLGLGLAVLTAAGVEAVEIGPVVEIIVQVASVLIAGRSRAIVPTTEDDAER